MEGLPRAVRGDARLSERAHLFGAVAADRRPRRGDHAGVDLVAGDQEGADSRLDPRPTTCAPARSAGRSTPCPRPGEFGNDTWEGDSWRVRRQGHGLDDDERRRGAGLRLPADQHRGARLLRRPSAGQQPVRREHRVPRRSTTGRRVWHFQTVHHGLWDYDNPAAPNLLDITVDGRRVKAVAQVTKQGFVYTFDRVTGAADLADRRAAGAAVRRARRAGRRRRSHFRPGRRRSSTRASRRRPGRLHARDARRWRSTRSSRSTSGRCSRRHRWQGTIISPGTVGRRQLVRRGGRSRDRHALCPVAQRA